MSNFTNPLVSRTFARKQELREMRLIRASRAEAAREIRKAMHKYAERFCAEDIRAIMEAELFAMAEKERQGMAAWRAQPSKGLDWLLDDISTLNVAIIEPEQFDEAFSGQQ